AQAMLSAASCRLSALPNICRLAKCRMLSPQARHQRPCRVVERWVAPDQELVLYRLAETFSEQITQENTDAPAVGDNRGPVIAGQLRAPRRWECLLVEAAVIGGRERWRRRIDGLANDLRIKLSELTDEDEARASIVARTLEDLDAFAGYALPLIEV